MKKINGLKIEELTPKIALELKAGDQVIFFANAGFWCSFPCIGTIKRVYKTKSGLPWVEVEDIKSLDNKYAHKKTSMRKQVGSLYGKVLK